LTEQGNATVMLKMGNV